MSRPPLTSRYTADMRVTVTPVGYRVLVADITVPAGLVEYQVCHAEANTWAIFEGPLYEMYPVQVAGGGYAIGIADADKAIGAVAGDPQ